MKKNKQKVLKFLLTYLFCLVLTACMPNNIEQPKTNQSNIKVTPKKNLEDLLQNKATVFSDQGLELSLRLPEDFDRIKSPKTNFNNELAVFGAEARDKETAFFIITQNRGEKPAEQTIESKYARDKAEDELRKIYRVKELNLKKWQDKKRVIHFYHFKRSNKQRPYAYIYHIQTDNGIIQMICYTSDKSVEKSLTASVRSLKEVSFDKQVLQEQVEQENEEQVKGALQNQVINGKNFQMTLADFGTSDDISNKKMIAVVFNIKNTGQEPIKPIGLISKISVLQNGHKLDTGTQNFNVFDKYSVANADMMKDIAPNKEGKAVIFFILENDSDVTLKFETDSFNGQKEIKIPSSSYLE